MVEFALVAPLFFLIVFAGIEVGLMFRSYLAIENTSRSVARIASIERSNPMTDQLILERVATLTGPLQGEVTNVVIYNAATLDTPVPDDCIDNGVGAFNSTPTCNSYAITDGNVAAAAAGPAETGWPPDMRAAGDNVGIYIELEYEFVTGFFTTINLSSSTVEVIEANL